MKTSELAKMVEAIRDFYHDCISSGTVTPDMTRGLYWFLQTHYSNTPSVNEQILEFVDFYSGNKMSLPNIHVYGQRAILSRACQNYKRVCKFIARGGYDDGRMNIKSLPSNKVLK